MLNQVFVKKWCTGNASKYVSLNPWTKAVGVVRGVNTKSNIPEDVLALFKMLVCKIRPQNKLLDVCFILKFSKVFCSFIPINLSLETNLKTKNSWKKWYVSTWVMEAGKSAAMLLLLALLPTSHVSLPLAFAELCSEVHDMFQNILEFILCAKMFQYQIKSPFLWLIVRKGSALGSLPATNRDGCMPV